MKPKIHYTIRADHISHDQGRDRMQGPWDLQQSQSLHLGFSQLKLFGTRKTEFSPNEESKQFSICIKINKIKRAIEK